MAAPFTLPPGSYDYDQMKTALEAAIVGDPMYLERRYQGAAVRVPPAGGSAATIQNTRANSRVVRANTTGFAAPLAAIQQRLTALGG